MTEPDDALLRRLRERGRLANGGGGSDDGGMLETRVATLETDVREIKTVLVRMEPLLRSIDDNQRKMQIELAELKGRVSQLPSTWQMLLGGISLVGFGFLLVRIGLR